jgi:diaminopimelate epimerase
VSAGPTVVKMSGAGNDFLVVGPEQARKIEGATTEWVRRVCRRGLSVGADGVLFVEPRGNGRILVRFHNPDGSTAFCGNGSRCAARFARLQGYVGDAMVLETAAGEIRADIEGDRVRLVLAAPRDHGTKALEVCGERIEGRWVIAGVPHFVVRVPAVDVAPLSQWGPAIRRHPEFGEAGTNLDLLAATPAGPLALRTWERGVEAETLACGSGAIAAAFAARLGGAEEWIQILPAGGVMLEVGLPGERTRPDSSILIGDARVIFETELDAEAISGFPLGLID